MSIVFLFSQMVLAQEELSLNDKNYRISIELHELFYDFDFDTVDIQINSSEMDLKGFALKIAVQTEFFNIDSIITGDFYNDCSWEFFNSRQVISDFSAENYLQVWQIIGLSEIFPDSISPICHSNETKQSLAKIIISRNSYSQTTDSIIPIFFLWEDCADNTLSGMSGNDLFVSDKIFQYFENQPQFQTNQFPSTQGIPFTCLSKSALNSPIKLIDFLHGGVVLRDRPFDDSLILNK